VGLGTQDSFEMAQDFVAEYGTTSFPMLWDPTFDSWAHLGVAGQPAWVLMSPDGTLVQGSYGPIDESFVLDYVSG
jgi:hypothetical protein